MNIYFYTLGCKVNQYESQEMGELLEKDGHCIVHSAENAEACVINSCTVTAESVRKTRQAVRRLKKQKPSAVIILTGCASQAEPNSMKDMPEIDIFMGNRSNTAIADALKEYCQSNEYLNKYIEHRIGDPFLGTGITRFDKHTRAFLKIQDGCDRFCSYCLIPTARGRSRSKSLENIDREIAELSKNGYKEIVFVGINLSDYGKNTPYSLPDALMLCEKYPAVERVRLGSLEPDHITEDMIAQLKKVSKLCPQFHISLQSGCDSVLKAMNRHYTADEYARLAENLRRAFPDATLTTDVLVGFPTESEEDFCTTVDFVKNIGFEKVHVFPYSVREGTKAAKMEQLPKSVKEKRAEVLGEVASNIRREYLRSQKGKVLNVLFETSEKGFNMGHTENYTPVKVKSEDNLQGCILPVKISDFEDDVCIGIL